MIWLFKSKLNVVKTFEQRLSNIEQSINKYSSQIIKHDAEILEITIALEGIRNKVLRKIQNRELKTEEELPPDGLPRVR